MKQSKKHTCRKQTTEERGKKALSRVVDKIGEEDSQKVKTEFSTTDKSEQDGINMVFVNPGPESNRSQELAGY